MCDKTMENYKPNMFQLQCLKALEIQIEEGKGYNEAEIGRKMQVNRSTISRCFKGNGRHCRIKILQLAYTRSKGSH